jgi:hypothetical protein
MPSHRTTARGVLLLLLIGVFTGTASAAEVPETTPFPVVGNVTYTDDFGDPRPGGTHEGNDLMSVRHQPAIAFVAGRVQTYVPSPGSPTGTCMLYLHAKNGMTYVYIHLNNDLGPKNDNKGHCKGGVSWPSGINGDRVRRGELVGFVGDSGDANGIQPHLHFEVRKPSGRAINPFSHLKKSKHLLFPRTPADSKVTLKGTKVLDKTADSITVRTKRIVVPSLDLDYLYARKVTLSASDATVRRKSESGSLSATRLSDAKVGERARIVTTAFDPTWARLRATPNALAVESLLLLG